MVGLNSDNLVCFRKKWFCSIIAGSKVIYYYICNIGGLELCFNNTVVKV